MEKPISGPLSDDLADDIQWAERSEFWRKYSPTKRGGSNKKFHFREPIILCGHGVMLRVNHGTLFIRNGFTHYPQKQDEIRLFPGDGNLPDRIIILDGNGAITFDALAWMADQKIELVQLDWQGRVQNVGGIGYCANAKLVERQRQLRISGREPEFARWLIQEKIAESAKTLSVVIPKSEIRDKSISRLDEWHLSLRHSPKNISLSKILGAEGDSAAAYFGAWQGIPLKWSDLKRRPIPPNWREIGSRTMGWKKRGTNARHPINAMLNYGYAILLSQLRAQIIAAGFDPTVGLMHGNSRNNDPLAYDLMEPLRPVVDFHVLKFGLSQIFTPGDFTINKLGGCRLNPQMARAVAKNIDLRSDVARIVGEFRNRLNK